jgi:hypothetical protein
MLTGIECANSQFSLVQFGSPGSKYLQIRPVGTAKTLQTALQTRDVVTRLSLLGRKLGACSAGDGGPGDAITPLLDRVSRKGVGSNSV